MKEDTKQLLGAFAMLWAFLNVCILGIASVDHDNTMFDKGCYHVESIKDLGFILPLGTGCTIGRFVAKKRWNQ